VLLEVYACAEKTLRQKAFWLPPRHLSPEIPNVYVTEVGAEGLKTQVSNLSL